MNITKIQNENISLYYSYLNSYFLQWKKNILQFVIEKQRKQLKVNMKKYSLSHLFERTKTNRKGDAKQKFNVKIDAIYS